MEFTVVNTGGEESKFGINLTDITTVQKVAKKYNLKIVGVYSHICSGFYKTKEFKNSVKAVIDVALKFENIKFLDFGGGYGVSYNPNKKDIDISDFSQVVKLTFYFQS